MVISVLSEDLPSCVYVQDWSSSVTGTCKSIMVTVGNIPSYLQPGYVNILTQANFKRSAHLDKACYYKNIKLNNT